MTAEHEQIRELQRIWIEATGRGDVDMILDLMTDDVEFLTPGRPPFGRDQFADELRGATSRAQFSGSANAEELEIAGDWAFAKTRIEITVVPAAGGGAKKLAGYALSVFRRCRDGKWRLSRDANLVSPVS